MWKNWKVIFGSCNRHDQYLNSILTILKIAYCLSSNSVKFKDILDFLYFWQLIPFSESICIGSANQWQKWAVWRIFWTKYVCEWTNKGKGNGKQDRTNGGIQGQCCLVSRSSYSLQNLKALHFDLERAHEVVLGLVKRVLMVLGPKEMVDDRLLKEVCWMWGFMGVQNPKHWNF